jgi:hypothetical protein
MARKAMRPPPPLILKLLRALQEATKEEPPEWVAIESLGLRVDRVRLDQAIVLAALSGWLKISGNPPKTLSMTREGSALVELSRQSR